MQCPLPRCRLHVNATCMETMQAEATTAQASIVHDEVAEKPTSKRRISTRHSETIWRLIMICGHPYYCDTNWRQRNQQVLSGRQRTSIAEPSAVFGTTMKRRESGGTLSGSGGTFRSPEPLRPPLPPFFRLQCQTACQLPRPSNHAARCVYLYNRCFPMRVCHAQPGNRQSGCSHNLQQGAQLARILISR